MSDEIIDFDEQLAEIITEIRAVLENDVAKLQGKAKLEKCEYLRNRLNRAKQLLKSFNVELRELDRADAKPYEEKSRNYDQELTKIADDISWATTSAERDDLFGKKGRNADEMTAKDLVSEAKNIQEQSKASTTRAKQVLEHTIQVGTETADALKKQTEQIENVDKTVDIIDSNLSRADRQIRIFVRRMASDKFVMVLILLVVLAITAAVVVRIVKQKMNGQVSSLQDVSRLMDDADALSHRMALKAHSPLQELL